MSDELNMNYTEVNAKAVDAWVDEGWIWSQEISHEAYINAKNGQWDLVLTPEISVPKAWFAPYLKDGRLDGVKILGLASGGGQQMPIFAALGAEVTLLDYSENQLNKDRLVAEREQCEIEIIRADMTKKLPFADSRFDIIFHPVSNCYIEDVYHVWNECFRVLKKDGLLLSGVDNGFVYMFDEEDEEPLKLKYPLPYNPLKDPKLYKRAVQVDGGSIQFSHTFEEQVGGQLKAGLRLTDLLEDRDSNDELGKFFPQFLMTRAIKP